MNTSAVFAYQLAEGISIRKFREEYTAELISATNFELFYRNNHGYIYVFNYGVVVFADVDEPLREVFLHQLQPYTQHPLEKPLSENFTIDIQENSPPVFGYNSVVLPEKTPALYRIVMLQVAQSVALDFYFDVSQQLLSETVNITNQLEQKGRLTISKRRLLKVIGKAMNTKNRIADNLYIIDTPPSVWENELLGKVHDGLYQVFDIHLRFREVEYTLKIIEDNVEVFIELINTRQNQLLELIVIILILIEVVQLLIG